MIKPHTIHILPEDLVNKIAAGEVVQRPASVAKELIENSLDAGARNIVVEIEDGGINLIRIVDDGSGMTEEDALVSLQRHATSKIAEMIDLERIATYGFRGEALPSIAAVSRLSIKTRSSVDDAGVLVRVEAGRDPDVTREPREVGTTVTVRNLFYNVPARRKFLKARETEFRHLYDVVQRFALSRPETGVTFISDGDVILDLKPSTHHERVTAVLGERQMSAMVPLQREEGPVVISGYIGKPSFGQKLRGKQFLFLNNRSIVNRAVAHAVFTGYENLILKNSYPSYLLFLEIDPAEVDVNVHPAKAEVKFANEQAIYAFIQSVVRKTISTSGVPALSVQAESAPLASELRFSPRQHVWPAPFSGRDGLQAASSLLGPGRDALPAASPSSTERIPADPIDIGPLVQMHRKYILLQVEGGLMIVDQHVAHERILYERIRARMASANRPSQQLLFPVSVDLNPGDASLLREILPRMEELGFGIREFSGNSFVIESVPPEAAEGEEAGVIEDLLLTVKENPGSRGDTLQDLLAKSLSCASALTAGKALSETEMRSLVRELFETETPFVCPHGRPTVMRISEDELDRRFGRS